MMMIGTDSLLALPPTREHVSYLANQGYLSRLGWSPDVPEIVIVREGISVTTVRQPPVGKNQTFVDYRGTAPSGRDINLRVNLI